ncbi:MAG: carotenoid oxygenase family protein [Myxococcota bacterium]
MSFEPDASHATEPFYLRGPHAPVEHEVEAFDLPIEGALPPELVGLYLRNGPNPAKGDPGHWFLGDGMLHAVELANGRARSFRSRFVRTRALRGLARYVDHDGRVDFTASPANTHVIAHAGRILALAENGFPWQVDRRLETVGLHDFDGRLRGPMTAHPKRCPQTGELHFFGYHFAEPHLVYHRADRSGELVLSRPIDLPRPVMMHDFAITRDFVLFFDLPIVFSPEAIAKGGMPYAFDAKAGARLGILRRDAPEDPVIWLEIEPCYFFHPVNAWNDGDAIRLDVARYPELWSRSSGRFDSAYLYRYALDRARGRVREERIDDLAIEFPRVREDRTGLRHRFGYATHTRDVEGALSGAALVRYDDETGERAIWAEDRWLPGEAVFVAADPRPDSAEGDGWLLAYLHDRGCGPSALAVFEAGRIEQGPVARVRLPQRVPFGFHGSWIPEPELGP